ncbi:MAG: hypothetical protein ABSF69_08500 [Polyangiaceae bacterium]
MSKRSRRERRAHRHERALVQGDLSVLENEVERSPRSAVALLTRALANGAPPDAGDAAQGDRGAQLDAIAVRLSRKLRRAGEPVQALAVAAAGGRRTPELRIEEALAAFAAGNDELAAQLVAGDPGVATAIGPLLQAVRGEVAAPATPAAPLRALHAVARAVGHAVRGEVDLARAVVRHIPRAARSQIFAEEIGAAAALQAPEGAIEALVTLSRSPRVPRDAEARRRMAAEAALSAEQLAALPPVLMADPHLRARVVPARLAAATSPGTAAAIIGEAGIDLFDPSERPAAALYLGFTQIRSNPAAASRSFDRAIALGADLIEALRGKWLAACESAHGRGAKPGRQAYRDAAAASDRLAHALEKTAHAGPLAAATGKVAALGWLEAGDAKAALESVARARRLAVGKFRDSLDLIETEALAVRSPADAERRLDALLEQAPGNVDAWKQRVALAATQGDTDRAQTLILAAAEATQDAELAARARQVLGNRRRIAPFEGMVPGAATAGALACELARTATEDDFPLPLAATFRDALGPGARLAFDGASIVIAATQAADDVAREHLRATLVAWRTSPRNVAKLSAVAVFAGLDDALLVASRDLDGAHDLPALTAMAEALAVAGNGKLAAKLLPRIAPGLSRDRIAFFKSLATGTRPVEIAGTPDPDQAARDFDLVLAPEFSMVTFVSEEDDDDPDLGFSDGEQGLFARLLDTLEIPLDEMLDIAPDKLRRLEQRLGDMIARLPPGPALMRAVADLLNESGIAPRPGRARRPSQRP